MSRRRHGILLIYSEEYERRLCEALAAGAEARGHKPRLVSLDGWKNKGVRPDADLVGFVSMAANRMPIYEDFIGRGKTVLYIDKGYVRNVDTLPDDVKVRWWRFAVNDLHPTKYLDRISPDHAKWGKMGVALLPRREAGDHVLLAGSTNRYHSWHGLKAPKEWALDVLGQIRALWQGPVLWRPKPSQWKRGIAFELPGCMTDKAKHGLAESLSRSRVLVTHGSAIACESVWAGVPTVCLGPSVAGSVSSRSLAEGLRTSPFFPTPEERLDWCGRLAACQYTLAEMRQGRVWDHVAEVSGLLHRKW